jgi:hypothetical membrane protein
VLRLHVIASLAIIFILSGFVLFLFGLFTQNYNWLPSVYMFAIGFILYFVARTIQSKKER